MWASLHAAGFGLLLLSGGWPSHQPVATCFHVLIAATLCLYAAASFRDPGYADTAAMTSARLAASLAASLAKPQEMQKALLEPPYCVHCHAELRARTKHCHDCCRCVRRMDHHCWWLGKCVGERTHCSFVSYLMAESLLLVSTCVFASAAAHAVATGRGADGRPAREPAGVPAPAAMLCAVLCAVLAALTSMASLVLLVFQCALVLRGETTWEKLKRAHLNSVAELPPNQRPYDRGPIRNVAIFCGCARDPGVAHWAEGKWSTAKPSTATAPSMLPM